MALSLHHSRLILVSTLIASLAVINAGSASVDASVGAGEEFRVSVPGAVGGGTVFGQLTVARVSGRGFVTAYGCDGGVPRDGAGAVSSSDLNFDGSVSSVASNRLVVSADADGDVCFYASADVDLIVDVVAVSDAVESIEPTRVDTRVTNFVPRDGVEYALLGASASGRTVVLQERLGISPLSSNCDSNGVAGDVIIVPISTGFRVQASVSEVEASAWLNLYDELRRPDPESAELVAIGTQGGQLSVIGTYIACAGSGEGDEIEYCSLSNYGQNVDFMGDANGPCLPNPAAGIRALQADLNAIGYGPVSVDGRMEPATMDALVRFAEDIGVPVTRRPDSTVLGRVALAADPADALFAADWCPSGSEMSARFPGRTLVIQGGECRFVSTRSAMELTVSRPPNAGIVYGSIVDIVEGWRVSGRATEVRFHDTRCGLEAMTFIDGENEGGPGRELAGESGGFQRFELGADPVNDVSAAEMVAAFELLQCGR